MGRYNSILRYSVTSLLTLFVAMFVMVASSYAAVDVQGKIKTSDGSTNAGGASVSVTCNATTIPTTADSPSGNFDVTFTDAQCAAGDTVTVNASFNGETATVNQSASAKTNFGNIILAAVAVPEFGLITGLVAAAGSGLAYMKMRKGLN